MSPAAKPDLVLVGDVGGTNVRFAVAEVSDSGTRLSDPATFQCADFVRLEDVLDAYFVHAKVKARPQTAVIAVAGPVSDGAARLTNARWSMSERDLIRAGFAQARLINDYTALALSVSRLGPQDLGRIGDAVPTPHRTIAVFGAGTGLGVGAIVRDRGIGAVATTEGGHIAFAPVDETEIEILRRLSDRFERVSLERILSGPGLVNLRWALGTLGGREPDPLKPEEVVQRAVAGEDPLCAETLERFCAIYGSAAGDIALVYGALGGVYLAGGIAPRILAWLRKSAFRRRFEAKGRFAGYVKPIATQVILHPYAALVGAPEVLRPA
jgi:glucokinase